MTGKGLEEESTLHFETGRWKSRGEEDKNYIPPAVMDAV